MKLVLGHVCPARAVLRHVCLARRFGFFNTFKQNTQNSRVCGTSLDHLVPKFDVGSDGLSLVVWRLKNFNGRIPPDVCGQGIGVVG